MRYAEKVLLHNLVQQTINEKDAYEALSDSADVRLWFMDKQKSLSVLDDILERYMPRIMTVSNCVHASFLGNA